ncbi:hypothetical protein GCM10010345_94200 [Streptomyces canarius]|uniref:N-acetyltransferase domain-containing protein n=1 Tax=Streptomyces canarius TaxID=285453 RepID=A0ABQ3DBZ2_9ACTN|nr:GNAT family N-acetyltransferase [Streptomyces canarius]GHA77856.1 hypothetical protein GCM10010345_94200 [Streptomyces canarius]
MVTLRPFALDDAPALQQIVSGHTARFTHGHDMTAEEAAATIHGYIDHDQGDPRTHWNPGIEVCGDLIGLVKARLRADGAAALSYLLREDSWGTATPLTPYGNSFPSSSPTGCGTWKPSTTPATRPRAESW